MAQASRRLKAARRVKRQNTLLHRQASQLRADMEPIIRRAQVEGQLLRNILNMLGPVYMSKAVFADQLRGDIDISPVPDIDDVEIRYIPTPLEQSKVTGSGSMEAEESPVSYAEPEAAV